MQQSQLLKYLVIAGCVLFVILLLTHPSAPAFFPLNSNPPSVSLVYASAGSMAQLLNTGQIDAFLIWEPVVANAELSGIGKRIAVPADLPPPGKWDNAAINILVLREDITQTYPDISALLSALTTAAINRTSEEPALAENITANWVFGTNPILTPQGTLDPLDVEHRSFANMVFTADAEPPEATIVQSAIASVSGGSGAYDPMDWVNTNVTERAALFLNGTEVPQAGTVVPTLNIGTSPQVTIMLPSTSWSRTRSISVSATGSVLCPDDPNLSRPVHCTLYVNGTPAAHINLIMGQSGGGLMTTIGQKALTGRTWDPSRQNSRSLLATLPGSSSQSTPVAPDSLSSTVLP